MCVHTSCLVFCVLSRKTAISIEIVGCLAYYMLAVLNCVYRDIWWLLVVFVELPGHII